MKLCTEHQKIAAFGAFFLCVECDAPQICKILTQSHAYFSKSLKRFEEKYWKVYKMVSSEILLLLCARL